MCVLALAWRADPRWQLLIAANRDELHARPTLPLSSWTDPAGIIAGRDLQAGGTWLGVSDQPRLVGVTNLHGFGSLDARRPSRGRLVIDLLNAGGGITDPQTMDLEVLNPFNMMVVEPQRALFITNRPYVERRMLRPGYYSLSNGPLDAPWPKAGRLIERLQQWTKRDRSIPADLLDDLRDARSSQDDSPPFDTLGDRRAKIFIQDPVYGTRCSTVIAIDVAGAGVIVERRYSANASVTGETAIAFEWPPHG